VYGSWMNPYDGEAAHSIIYFDPGLQDFG